MSMETQQRPTALGTYKDAASDDAEVVWGQ